MGDVRPPRTPCAGMDTLGIFELPTAVTIKDGAGNECICREQHNGGSQVFRLPNSTDRRLPGQLLKHLFSHFIRYA